MTNRTIETKPAAALLLAALALTISAPVLAQYGPPAGAGTGVAVTPVTAGEAKTLQFMREEEKLARDVYRKLHEKWNLTVFENIASSEQRHFSSIGTLLARYGVPDPAQTTAPGVFTDAALNTLYNELIAKGMKSAQDAMEVGTLVEKRDIADLETALKGTAKLDVKRVYTNLMKASYNHQEAFETGCALLSAAPAAR